MGQLPLDVTVEDVKVLNVPYELEVAEDNSIQTVIRLDTKKRIKELVLASKALGSNEVEYTEKAEGN